MPPAVVIGVAAFGGIAVGAALTLLLRRERPVQLAALGLMALAVALALVLAGAILPGLAVGLVGVIGVPGLMAPLAREYRPQMADPRPVASERRLGIAISALAAAGATGLLIGAGVAGRSLFSARRQMSPSLVEVGHRFLLGAGVGTFGAILLAGAIMVGAASLIARDRRELAEEQADAARRRRVREQQRRAEQREAARAAARAARRGAPR